MFRWLFHLNGRCLEKICPKALWDYSASILMNHFSIPSWERPRPIICMIPRFSKVSMTPNTNRIYLGDPTRPHIIQGRSLIVFENHICFYIFLKLQVAKTWKWKGNESWRNSLNLNNSWICLMILESYNILEGRYFQILEKIWWLWNQYLGVLVNLGRSMSRESWKIFDNYGINILGWLFG